MRTCVLLLAISSGSLAFAADQPDLTGTWVCNLGQSKGSMAKMQSMSLKVTRKGELLHAIQTMDDGNGNGSKTFESDWFMDGKLHPVDMSANLSPNKMTTMSKWDGNALVSERKSEDGTFDEKMRITFSGDGKTATEHLTVKAPNGGGTNSMLVWQKQ